MCWPDLWQINISKNLSTNEKINLNTCWDVVQFWPLASTVACKDILVPRHRKQTCCLSISYTCNHETTMRTIDRTNKLRGKLPTKLTWSQQKCHFHDKYTSYALCWAQRQRWDANVTWQKRWVSNLSEGNTAGGLPISDHICIWWRLLDKTTNIFVQSTTEISL